MVGIRQSGLSSETLDVLLCRMVLILHQPGVSHSNSHRPDQLLPPQGHCNHGNASVRAAFIHVVGDLVQSVGVLLAAAIIHLWVGVRGTFVSMFRKANGPSAQMFNGTKHRFTELILFLFDACVTHSLNIK